MKKYNLRIVEDRKIHMDDKCPDEQLTEIHRPYEASDHGANKLGNGKK